MKADVRSFKKWLFGRRLLHPIAMAGLLNGVAASALQAGPPPPHTLSFSDPIGDPTGSIDVTGMVMSFRSNSGEYTIVLTADAAHPFLGQFRVNINLYDPSAPSGQSTFQHVAQSSAFDPKANKGNDFDLPVAQTTLTLTGHNQVLKSWKAGDLVATSTWAGLGNPPGAALFRSSVDGLPFTFLTNEDVIGYNDQTGDGSSGVATVN